MNDTRQLIKHIAIDEFSRNRYRSVSVASLCRKVGIANSVFYYYYPDRETLYREILEELFGKLDHAFGKIRGATRRERITSFIMILEDCHRQYAQEIEIYREGEYHFEEFDHALKAIYHSSLEMVFERPVSLAEYLFFASGVRFAAQRYSPAELTALREQLIDIICGGIFRDEFSLRAEDFHGFPVYRDDREDNTRTRMIHAGIELIGTHGFDQTQIFDIARSAGYSVGMFYKLFRDKISFLEELVSYMNHSLRKFLKIHELHSPSRTNVEVFGLYLCMGYFRYQKHYYTLIREAHFAVPEKVRRYYDALEQGYLRSMDRSTVADRALAANFLMGIAHFLGGDILFAENPPALTPLLLELGDLIHRGIVD